MMPKAVQRCTSHGWPSMPSPSSTAFTMPNWSLNIQRIMMAAITGATISGTISTVCTIFWPRKGRLSRRARPRPSSREPATLKIMKMKVLGSTTSMNAGSVITAR